MPEPDEFVLFRNALNDAERIRTGKPNRFGEAPVQILLENQREICAALALIIRGGHVPIEIARDLQERAKTITRLLSGQ